MKINIKKLTVSAIMIALATVLSLIKIIPMPLGGSVPLLSMLPICLVAIIYGNGWGLACSFIYSLIQMALDIGAVVSWGLTPESLAGTIILDYILPFTLIGLCGLFSNKGIVGKLLGISLTLFLRFTCHFISGVIIFDIWCEWKNVPLYSLCYNGGFMLPELIFTLIGAYFLFRSKAMTKLIDKYK